MDSKQLYKEIGLKIRSFRKSRGMSLTEFANLLNKSVSTVSKYEYGEVSISVDVLVEICNIFNVDSDSILPFTVAASHDGYLARYENAFEELLYIYWYNKEYNELRYAMIDNRSPSRTKSTLYLHVENAKDIDNASFIYLGDIAYSDTGAVFTYTNSLPPFDNTVVRIPSFARNQQYRFGLMTTQSYYYQNVAAKIAATSKPVNECDKPELLELLKVSSDEIKEIKRTNFFII